MVKDSSSKGSLEETNIEIPFQRVLDATNTSRFLNLTAVLRFLSYSSEFLFLKSTGIVVMDLIELLKYFCMTKTDLSHADLTPSPLVGLIVPMSWPYHGVTMVSVMFHKIREAI